MAGNDLTNGTDKSWDFKCTSDPNMTLRVSRVRGIGGFLVSIGDGLNGSRMVKLDGGEAARMSMAVLEASGKCTGDRNSIYTLVASYLVQAATAEKAAREQAELEAEALKLLLAFQAIDDPDNRGCEWHQYGTNTKDKWLAVARRAREMRAEK